MKTKAIEACIEQAGYEPEASDFMRATAAEARAELEAMKAQLAAKDAVLEDLFQACANLPIEYMDKMEKEINAASAALKGTQE